MDLDLQLEMELETELETEVETEVEVMKNAPLMFQYPATHVLIVEISQMELRTRINHKVVQDLLHHQVLKGLLHSQVVQDLLLHQIQHNVSALMELGLLLLNILADYAIALSKIITANSSQHSVTEINPYLHQMSFAQNHQRFHELL